jgi:hypothetical protein
LRTVHSALDILTGRVQHLRHHLETIFSMRAFAHPWDHDQDTTPSGAWNPSECDNLEKCFCPTIACRLFSTQEPLHIIANHLIRSFSKARADAAFGSIRTNALERKSRESQGRFQDMESIIQSYG